jgi:hypothetical protein
VARRHRPRPGRDRRCVLIRAWAWALALLGVAAGTACTAVAGLDGLEFDVPGGGGAGATGATVTGATSTGVQGGGGAPPTTCTAADPACDDGNACTMDSCDVGAEECVYTPLDGGMVSGVSQVAGDCHVRVCVAGEDTNAVDDTDIPNDTNICTDDVCRAGTANNPAVSDGTSCGGVLVCSAGVCVGCTTADDCLAALGPDDDCKTKQCTNQQCDWSFAPVGTVTVNPPNEQTSGNCKRNECDGGGGVVSVADDADVADDTSDCTDDVCAEGQPQHPPLPAGTACNQMGGQVCSGAGLCVECVVNSDCALPETCGGGGVPDACGCTSQPVGVTCTGKMCGTAVDNCGISVACPNLCGPGETCTALNRCACGPDMGAANQQACPDVDEYPDCTAGVGCGCRQAPDSCSNGFICKNARCECTSNEDCGGGGGVNCLGGPGLCACGAQVCLQGQTCNQGACTCLGGSCED